MEIRMQLTIDNQIITFHVQSTKKTSFSLELSPEGLITIKAPKNSTEEDIIKFVRKNGKKLLEGQARIENRQYITSQKQYTENENFMFLGKILPLSDILETIPESEEETQALLKKFYTNETKKIIKQRVAHYEKIIGVTAKDITIVDSVKTWGTCNSKRQLTFNYRLSMAHMSAIDSVVIHELCHILHLNHDRSFWRKVGMYDPEYKKNQAYLDQFGFVMTI